MTDVAKLAIEIDSTGTKTGADQAVQSAERVKGAFTGMGRAVEQSGTGLRSLSPAAQALAKEYEQLRQRVREGTIAHEDFLKQQQILLDQMAKLPVVTERWTQSQQKSATESAKYSRAVQHQVNQLKGLSVEAQRAAAQEERLVGLRQKLTAAAGAQTQVAQSTVASGRAAAGAASGFARLERPLAAATVAASGLPGPLGRVASQLGLFAVGGPVTVGVLGGIAVVAAAWERWHKPLKELEDRLDAIREKNKDPLVQIKGDLETTEGQIAAKTREIEALQRATPTGPLAGEQALINEANLNRLIKERAVLYKNLGDLRKEQATTGRKTAEEERAQTTALRDLELRGAAAALEASGQANRAKLQLIAGQLQLRLEEIAANEKLTQAEKDRASAAERALAGAARQAVIEAQVAARRAEAVRLTQAEADAQAAILTARGRTADAERLLLDQRLQQQTAEVALMGHLTAQEKARLVIALETLAAYQRQSIAMKAAAEVLAKVNANFARQQTAVAAQQERTRRSPEGQLKTQDKAIDDLTRKFGDDIDRLLKDLRDKEIDRLEAIVKAHQKARDAAIGYLEILGTISPALADLAFAVSNLLAAIEGLKKGTATPKDVAAAVGAVGAAIPRTSAVGSAASGALTLGSAGFQIGGPVGAGVGALAGIASGLIGFGKSAREAEKQLRDNLRNWERTLNDWLDGITGALSSFEQDARDARRFVEQSLKEILGFAKEKGVRIDLGKDIEFFGDDEFVGVLRRIQSDLRRAGSEFSDEIGRLIDTYEEATEALAEQRRQAEAAVRDDLAVRELEAQGRSDEAARLRQSIQAANELREAEREKYDELTIAGIKRVQAMEAEALAAEQEARARKEAEDKALREQTFGEDLEVRRLAATGDIAGAEAYRRQLEKEREVREAITAGMGAYSIEILKQVQALEDVTAAQRKAREELAVSQDLDVRFLRSIGQDEAADELERDVARKREIDRAVESGYTPEQIDFLRKIQENEERKRIEGDQRAAEAARASGPNSVRDITGLSEQTGLRIDNRLFTATVLLREIRDLTRDIRQIHIATRGAGGGVVVIQAPGSDALYQDFDRKGANKLSTTNSAAGVKPST